MLRAPAPRRARAAWSVVAGLGAVVVGAFLPWAASGRTERSSFALFRVADRLGVVPDGVLATLARAWPLVPLLAAVAFAAAAAGWHRAGGALGVVVGLVAVVAAVVVARSPLPTREGAWLALGGGVVSVVAGVVALALPPSGRRRRPEVAGPVPAAPPAPR